MHALALAVLLVLTPPHVDADRATAVAKRDAAIERLEAGDYATALEICDAALAADDTYSDAWRTRAALCLHLDRLDEAEAACRRGLALAPDDHLARHNLALVHRGRGDLDRARDVFDEILAAEPDDLDARLQKGVLLIQLGDVDGAAELFTQIVERAPDHPLAHGNLAYCHLHAGDAEAALRAAEREIEITGGGATDWHNRAIALRRLGRSEAARASVERAVETDAGHLESCLMLGSMQIADGALDEAAAILAPHAGTDTRVDLWLAYVDLAVGRFADARAACDEVIAVDPERALALWIRGQAAFAQGDVEAAAADSARAFALDPIVDDIWRRRR